MLCMKVKITHKNRLTCGATFQYCIDIHSFFYILLYTDNVLDFVFKAC